MGEFLGLEVTDGGSLEGLVAVASEAARDSGIKGRNPSSGRMKTKSFSYSVLSHLLLSI